VGDIVVLVLKAKNSCNLRVKVREAV